MSRTSREAFLRRRLKRRRRAEAERWQEGVMTLPLYESYGTTYGGLVSEAHGTFTVTYRGLVPEWQADLTVTGPASPWDRTAIENAERARLLREARDRVNIVDRLRRGGQVGRRGEVEPKVAARRLLMSMLSPHQRQAYERCGYFDVLVKGDPKTYRIWRASVMNIYVMDGGRAIERWCVGPVGVPQDDVLLAQKLMIESGHAAELRAKANVYDMRAALNAWP